MSDDLSYIGPAGERRGAIVLLTFHLCQNSISLISVTCTCMTELTAIKSDFIYSDDTAGVIFVPGLHGSEELVTKESRIERSFKPYDIHMLHNETKLQSLRQFGSVSTGRLSIVTYN